MPQIKYGGYRLLELDEDIAPDLPKGTWIAWSRCNFDYDFAAPSLEALKAEIDNYQPQLNPWELPMASRELIAA